APILAVVGAVRAVEPLELVAGDDAVAVAVGVAEARALAAPLRGGEDAVAVAIEVAEAAVAGARVGAGVPIRAGIAVGAGVAVSPGRAVIAPLELVAGDDVVAVAVGVAERGDLAPLVARQHA